MVSVDFPGTEESVRLNHLIMFRLLSVLVSKGILTNADVRMLFESILNDLKGDRRVVPLAVADIVCNTILRKLPK